MTTANEQPQGVTLLELLASIPPDQMVEGTRIDVTRVDGSSFSVTLGPRLQVLDDQPWPYLMPSVDDQP